MAHGAPDPLLGDDGAEAVADLIDTLKTDPKNTARFTAAEALGKIGPSARDAVPALLSALTGDEGGGVQYEAATALGRIGDPVALPLLREAAKAKDNELARAAKDAIQRIETAKRTRG